MMNQRKTATVTVNSKYITQQLSPKRSAMAQKKTLKVSENSSRRPRTFREKNRQSPTYAPPVPNVMPPVPIEQGKPFSLHKLITDSDVNNLETIGEVSEASHTML